MATRFKSRNATPPTGCYEYELDGVTVTSKSRFDIARKVADLRRSHGLITSGDPFAYVEEYMCPRLPNGFCSQPSKVEYIHADEVKRNTAALFHRPCVTVDVIESRLATCLSCPKHVTRGFCMGCSGLIDWIYKGFAGRRSRLAPDQATGVCSVGLDLVAAAASIDAVPVTGAGYPDNCWRKGVQNAD